MPASPAVLGVGLARAGGVIEEHVEDVRVDDGRVVSVVPGSVPEMGVMSAGLSGSVSARIGHRAVVRVCHIGLTAARGVGAG
jgi:hypothetical protein